MMGPRRLNFSEKKDTRVLALESLHRHARKKVCLSH